MSDPARRADRTRRLRRAGIAVASALAVALAAELGYRGVLSVEAPRHAAGDFELYGVGESTMVGEPFHPKLSVPRLLDHMFGGRIAGLPLRIIDVAERGVPLYPQSIAFEHAVAGRDRRVPGVVLVMSGHNEKFDTGGDDRGAPDRGLGGESELVRDGVLALRRRRLLPRPRTFAAWEYYLRRIVETARASGLVPILATMASNVSRIEPNVDGSAAAPAAGAVTEGLALEDRGRFTEASALYRGRLAGAGAAPLLEYRLGRCAEALGDYPAAREHYWTAVDLDPRLLFGRATRAQNDLIRRLAREYAVPLVDAVEILEGASPHGILGDDMIMDGQHPTADGYVLLADAYAGILARRFDTPVVHPVRDAAEAERALGFVPRDLQQAAVIAGSWLIATSVGHPFPRDRMALAEKRFSTALGLGDDFSDYFGMALARATARGGILRNPDEVRALGGLLGYVPAYSVPAGELPSMLARLETFGVDRELLARVRTAAAGPAAASERR